MLNSIIDLSGVYFVLAVVTLVFSCFEAGNLKNRLGRLLFYQNLVFFYIYTYHGLYITGYLSRFPHLYLTNLPVAYFFMIFNIYIVRVLIDPGYKFSLPEKLLPAIPVIRAITLAGEYVKSASEKNELYFKHIDFNNLLFAPISGNLEIYVIYALAGSLWVLFILYKMTNIRRLMSLFKKENLKMDISLIISAFFLICVAMVAILGYQFIFESGGIRQVTEILIIILWISFYVVIKITPFFIQLGLVVLPGKEFSVKRYMKTRLNKVDLVALGKSLDHAMLVVRVFRYEKLTRTDVARFAGITPEQLSEYLNSFLNKSFNEYVNDYRIEEGKKLLLEENDLNTTHIGFETGFSSTSAWHKAFKDATGMTPAEYKEEYGKKHLCP